MKLLRFITIFLLLNLLIACAAPIKINIPNKEPPPLKLTKHPHIALVLGGGGTRGFAHVGVINALAKAGIPIDLIVGTSAGSIVGALYADNADAKFVEKVMKNSKFFDFADITYIPHGHGFISGRKLQHFLHKNMRSSTFNELKIPLVVVATDLRTGHAKIISSGPIPPAINASSAMPGAVHPVKLYGYTLVDGGIVSQTPVNIAKRYQPDIIIAVNLDAELPEKMPRSFAGVFERSFRICIHSIAHYSEEGADITIHPILGTSGTFDFHEKNKLICAGEVAAQKVLPKIKALIQKKL